MYHNHSGAVAAQIMAQNAVNLSLCDTRKMVDYGRMALAEDAAFDFEYGPTDQLGSALKSPFRTGDIVVSSEVVRAISQAIKKLGDSDGNISIAMIRDITNKNKDPLTYFTSQAWLAPYNAAMRALGHAAGDFWCACCINTKKNINLELAGTSTMKSRPHMLS